MRRIHMLRTRNTRAGLLKAGKSYPVPADVAVELVDEGVAVALDASGPERAVAGPPEDTAKRTKRVRTRRTVRKATTVATGSGDE